MAYQEERFKTAEERNARWQQLREQGTAHVVRYSVSVAGDLHPELDRFLGRTVGHMEFVVAWPTN
jgi:hypothetical protein